MQGERIHNFKGNFAKNRCFVQQILFSQYDPLTFQPLYWLPEKYVYSHVSVSPGELALANNPSVHKSYFLATFIVRWRKKIYSEYKLVCWFFVIFKEICQRNLQNYRLLFLNISILYLLLLYPVREDFSREQGIIIVTSLTLLHQS